MSSISVIVPTFRRPNELALLLDSLFSGTVIPDEVVIVDNDPEASCVTGWPPAWRVRVIHAGLGLNLAGARNRGWQSSASELCFFIDDDNVVAPATLSVLKEAATRKGVGFIAPVIFDGAVRGAVWCAGVSRSMATTRSRFLYRGRRELPALERWPTDDMPDAFLIPRHILVRVGGFDEVRFPFHYDEADICARIRACGLEGFVIRNAVVSHYGGTAANPGNELLRAFELSGSKRVELMAYARVAFHRTHSRGFRKALAVLVFVPLYVLFTSAACMTVPGRPTVRLRTIGALVKGSLRGYLVSINRRASKGFGKNTGPLE